jgi:hypothetical protein
VDVVVDNADDPKAGPPQAIRPTLVAAIAAAPGAQAVAGVVVGEKVTMVGRDGRPLRHHRAANLILSWWLRRTTSRCGSGTAATG